CVDIEGVFRLVQSIPSPKAEPIKLQLAKLAAERVEEIADPELGITRAKMRAVDNWRRQGHSEAWIIERLKGIDVRHGYTDALRQLGASSPADYAKGTAIAHNATFGLTPAKHKILKDLPVKAKLRENMIKTELALTSFSETFLTDMAEKAGAYGKTLEQVQDEHA